jgi:hypothetical protein
MYIVNNKETDLIIGKFKTDAEFIDFMNTILKENGDENFSIIGVSDAVEYLNDYCDNLELVAETYTVSLTFTDISEASPYEAVQRIIGWIKEDGVNNLVFDVTNEITDEKFTVDMDAEGDVAVLPNVPNQELIDMVLEQIKKDVQDGDVTSVNEMLKSIPQEYLVSYLPQK